MIIEKRVQAFMQCFFYLFLLSEELFLIFALFGRCLHRVLFFAFLFLLIICTNPFTFFVAHPVLVLDQEIETIRFWWRERKTTAISVNGQLMM